MTRILVVGATGVFGSRLVEGLAATTDLIIICAGRDRRRSEALAAEVRLRHPAARIETATIDVRTVTSADLLASGASIIVDASGPFQGAEPHLAKAAIAARIDYLDLADARDFVARFPALDGEAKASGVVAMTGVSSTPALSHAVLDALTAGWRRIDWVEVGISPGSRAPLGRSVVAAILGYVGRPVRVFAKGKWQSKPGWSGTVRRRVGNLGTRRFALAETPDLDLLVARYRPRDAALFRAGLELGLLHHGLAVLAWLPRLGLVRSLSSLAPLLRMIARTLAPLGSDRGGMIVEAAGRDAQDRAIIARWTLCAEAGDGPSVPTLPALALIRKLVTNRETVLIGAYAGAGAITLDAVAAEFTRLRIKTESEADLPRAPVETALGPQFELLPEMVKAAHRSGPVTRLEGTARVEGAENAIGAVVARLFGFPRRRDQVPVRVSMRLNADGTETWERNFGGQRFRSRLSARGTGVVGERFGPFDFDLSLLAERDGLTMRVAGWRLCRLRLPRQLAPRSVAIEYVDSEGRFCFDVPIAFPLIGRLVRYQGWLVMAPHTESAPESRSATGARAT